MVDLEETIRERRSTRVKPPNVPQLPESHAHLGRELGAIVYGAMGIERHDG